MLLRYYLSDGSNRFSPHYEVLSASAEGSPLWCQKEAPDDEVYEVWYSKRSPSDLSRLSQTKDCPGLAGPTSKESTSADEVSASFPPTWRVCTWRQVDLGFLHSFFYA